VQVILNRSLLIHRLTSVLRGVYVALMILTIVLLPFVLSTEPSSAAGNITPPCDLNSSEPCEPPRISEIQYLITRLIYTAWAFGGVVFMVLLVIIGGIYLTSAGDPQKVEIAKKRAGQWVIGVFLYFLAQPITATLMRGLVSGDAECFANLQDPGFTFFFPNVCDVQEVVDPNAPPVRPECNPENEGVTFNSAGVLEKCLGGIWLDPCGTVGQFCGSPGETRCYSGDTASARYCKYLGGASEWEALPNPNGTLSAEDASPGGCCQNNPYTIGTGDREGCPAGETCTGTDGSCASGLTCEADTSDTAIGSTCTLFDSLPQDRCCLEDNSPNQVAQTGTYVLLNQDLQAPYPASMRDERCVYVTSGLSSVCQYAGQGDPDEHKCICGNDPATSNMACITPEDFCAKPENGNWCFCQEPDQSGCLEFPQF